MADRIENLHVKFWHSCPFFFCAINVFDITSRDASIEPFAAETFVFIVLTIERNFFDFRKPVVSLAEILPFTGSRIVIGKNIENDDIVLFGFFRNRIVKDFRQFIGPDKDPVNACRIQTRLVQCDAVLIE